MCAERSWEGIGGLTTYRVAATCLCLTIATLPSCSRERPGPIEGAGQGASRAPLPGAPISPPTADGASALSPGPTGGAEPVSVREVEPNDSRARAQPLLSASPESGAVADSELGATVHVTASLSQPKDVDWYHVVPRVKPSQLRVEVQPAPTSDVRIELYVGERRQPVRWVDNAPAGALEAITNFAIEEPAWVVVKHPRSKSKRDQQAGDQHYEMRLSLGPVGRGEEQEPNGSATRSQAMSLDEDHTGWLNTPDDEDYYHLDAAPGAAAIQVDVIGLPRDAEVRIGAENGTRAQAVRGEVSLVPLRPPTASEPVRVAISAHGTAGVDAPYRIRVRALTAEQLGTDPLEPNDGAALATPLALDTPSQGSLGWPGDEDWYVTKPDSPGLLRIEARPLNGTQTLALLIPRGGAIARVKARGAGEPVVLPNAPSGGEPVAFGVAAVSHHGDEAVSFEVSTSWRDAAGEEREPNDGADSLESNRLTLDQSLRGYIGWSGDTDLYAVALGPEGSGSILTARLRAPDDLPVVLRLLSTEETPPKELGTVKEVPAGEERTLTHFFGPGRYALEVRAAVADSSSGREYRLSISR